MHADQHDPDQILNALRMGVDYSFTIRVRGLELKARPLSLSEYVGVVNDVQAEMSQKAESERNTLTESMLMAMRTMEKATTPEPDSRIAPKLTAHVMQKMTNDEVIAIHRAYVAGCDVLDPSVESLDQVRMDELIEAAKKNDGALAGLPPLHLANLVRYLLTRSA